MFSETRGMTLRKAATTPTTIRIKILLELEDIPEIEVRPNLPRPSLSCLSTPDKIHIDRRADKIDART